MALVRDGADALGHPPRGLYGAIVVASEGSQFLDPATGEELDGRSSWRADVHGPDGAGYRDFALFLHDEDESIGSHRMPYTTEVAGTVAINYRNEPLDDRPLAEAIADGPTTPLVEAVAGDPVRLHVLAPWSEQAQVFSVEGHRWPQEPGLDGTPRLSSRRLGGLQALTLRLEGGAGGTEQLSGDYLYGNHRLPYAQAGAWGIFRVHEQPTGDLQALPDPARPLAWTLATVGSGALLLAGLAWTLARRRRGDVRHPAPSSDLPDPRKVTRCADSGDGGGDGT